MGGNQVGLLAADDDELLVLGLPETDTNGKIEIHGPEFDGARPGAVHGVDGEDHEAEDMDDQDGQQHQADLPHLDNGVMALEPKIGTGGIQEDGVDDCEGDVGDAIAVQVGGSKVEASGVEVNHAGEEKGMR